MLDAELGGSDPEKPRNRDAWTRVRGRLKAELGEEVFSCWFANMNLEHVDGGTVVMSVPSRFLKSWIATHYRDRLTSLWQNEEPLVRKIEVTVRSAIRARVETPARFTAPAAGPAIASVSKSTIRLDAPEPRRETFRPLAQPAAEPVAASPFDDISSPVDPRYTFDTFVEGGANRMALAAARQLADGRAPAASSSTRSTSIPPSARARPTSCRRSSTASGRPAPA